MKTSHSPEFKNGSGFRSAERRGALLVAGLTLAIYLRTLAPGLLAGDPGEFQFAAWNLGLAHPTGYPLYLILGYAWQHVLAFFGLSPAWALNAFSALCGAAAVTSTYIVQLRWLEGPRPVRQSAALSSALIFGMNPTFWNQSLIAEVYALHMLLMAAVVGVAQRVVANARVGSTNARVTLLLALLTGMALTHHALSIWLLPSLLLYLLFSRNRQHTAVPSNYYGALSWGVVAAALLPLLLYLYIPLRGGPEASPWYHQPLGEITLTLYENSWSGFLSFVSGQSISVGFRSAAETLDQLTFSLNLWRVHFTWPGLILMLLGIFALLKERRWPILLLTGTLFLLQQVFNLFYAIEDIFVYYIPLYWIGALWIGFAAAFLGKQATHQLLGPRSEGETSHADSLQSDAEVKKKAALVSGLVISMLLLIPIRVAQRYFTQIDQSRNFATRLRWEEILDAVPPVNAVLVSNDRNEIVPLFYFQYVEDRRRDLTGLFPLIAPDGRFQDVGTTIETALNATTDPVYLIKPMPGLETRFRLEALTPPLFRVLGDSATRAPQVPVHRPYGPLLLLGYDWEQSASDSASITISLHWRSISKVENDYTSTIQLYDARDNRIAQEDGPPGGIFYPTSLWKTDEILIDTHFLSLTERRTPVTMLVALYDPQTLENLAPALEISLAEVPPVNP